MVHISGTDWNQLDSVSNSLPDFKTVLLLPLASWEMVILSFWFILTFVNTTPRRADTLHYNVHSSVNIAATEMCLISKDSQDH